MSNIRSFEDLIVWQKAMKLAKLVYLAQRKLPREELYALGDQLRRAVVSIPSNIAEGYGRDTTKNQNDRPCGVLTCNNDIIPTRRFMLNKLLARTSSGKECLE